jgi:hypothetical protein
MIVAAYTKIGETTYNQLVKGIIHLMPMLMPMLMPQLWY